MGTSRAERHRKLSVVALCAACGSCGIAAGAAATPGKAAATIASPSPDTPPTAADVQAAQSCRDVHFVAYSTVEPGGQRVEESVTWDDRSKSYLVRGPILGAMLNDPGLSSIPTDAVALHALFRIAIRADYSKPLDRFCEYNFQEKADCDAHGNITYTQIFTDCDLQTLQHVVMITPDHAGSVALLDIRFQDVRGVFSDPLDISEGTDLRLRMR